MAVHDMMDDIFLYGNKINNVAWKHVEAILKSFLDMCCLEQSSCGLAGSQRNASDIKMCWPHSGILKGIHHVHKAGLAFDTKSKHEH